MTIEAKEKMLRILVKLHTIWSSVRNSVSTYGLILTGSKRKEKLIQIRIFLYKARKWSYYLGVV